jgi:Protein of unknown function (DUF4012)
VTEPIVRPEDAPAVAPTRHRRRPSRRIVISFVGVLALAAFGFLTLSPAREAQARLEDARAAMIEGRAHLVNGDTIAAADAFSRAEEDFTSGLVKVRNPFIQFVGLLPLVGRTPDTVEVLADAGSRVARAGRIATSAINRFPGGLAGLAPSEGALPIEALTKIAPALERARVLTESATDMVESTESSLLYGPVAEARAEFRAELVDASRLLRSGAALANELPGFLGQDGRRRYFFGAQNPAELRGTGGFLGAFAILTIDEGRLEFGPFEPIQTLRGFPGNIPPPNPSFAERYDRFGGNGFWANINMTPDFPSAATAIERLYEAVEKEELDGTIVADPFALQALLGMTGPVLVEGTDVTLDATNAVQVLSHDAYIQFPDPNVRKLVLGESARLIFDRFLTDATAADPVGAAKTLMQVGADGHLLMHAADPAVQETFEVAGISGQLQNPEGDFLGVFLSNAAANKADFYLEPLITYDVQLRDDGSAEATATVELRNQAPAEGLPDYIIGPFDERFEAGENRSYVSTYCASSCRLESFEAPGEETEVIGSQEELGHPVFSTFVNIQSGESAVLKFHVTLPDAVESNGAESRYLLTYQGQNTIRPTSLTVNIQAPDGSTILSTTPGLEPNGTQATWVGPPGDQMTWELAFQGTAASPGWIRIGLLVTAALLLVGALAGLLAWYGRKPSGTQAVGRHRPTGPDL